MKNLWEEITKKSLVKLVITGIILVAATSTATYLVTERASPKTAPQRIGSVPEATPMSGELMNPDKDHSETLYRYDPVEGFIPMSPQEAKPLSQSTQTEPKEKEVVHVHHYPASTPHSSDSRSDTGVLGGLSKTTKGALIGGVLGASGGALMGGRGKHKAGNGALVGGAVGAVAGGILGHSLEKK